jgi:D-proline reductase (dithiol) PrdB
MQPSGKIVDGFHFLPPSLAAWIRKTIPDAPFEGPIPWAPLKQPVARTTFALVTSAGIRLRSDPPFDMEREKREPTWGDRSHRTIPKDPARRREIAVNHLHINPDYILQDINVMLPIDRMAELEREGAIGRLAETHYAFYGFQWESTEFVETAIAPMAAQMAREEVQAALLTPA